MTTGGREEPGRRWAAGVAWGVWGLAMVSLGVIWWLDRLLRAAGRADRAPLGAGVAAPVLAAVSAATVGAVLASRRPRHPVGRPRHPVGRPLLALGLAMNASGVASAYADYGLLARPGSLPAAREVSLYLPAFIVPALALLGFVLLLTPTGTLPSARWRWWARATVAASVVCPLAIVVAPRSADPGVRTPDNPLDLTGLGGALLVVYQLAFAVTNVAVLVGGASLVVRFRRASGAERQQLRWVALAAALTAFGSLAILATFAVGASPVLLGWVAGVYVAILPVALAAAILRYRLYDLDRIISRTLAYALLTVLLGLGYALVVLGLGRLVSEEASTLAVAGATLAVAAAFQPLRRRVQGLVDRRFNRRRHDAAATIEAFSGRLHEQVDLDTLTAELLALVDQTMQPTRASLWLRPSLTTPAGRR